MLPSPFLMLGDIPSAAGLQNTVTDVQDSVSAAANGVNNVAENIQNAADAIQDVTSSVATSLEGLDAFVYGFFDSSGGMASQAIKDILIINSADENVLSVMNVFYDMIAPIGFMLMIIYFLAGLSERTMSGKEISIEEFIFSIVKIVVGGILVANGIGIINFALSSGNFLIEKVWSIMTVDTPTTKGINTALENMIKEMDMMTKLIACIPGLIVYILRTIAYALLKMQAFTRVFELLFRIVMVPIGLADLFSEGMRSSGIRFVKKLVACSINGALMLVTIYVMGFLAADSLLALGNTGSESADFWVFLGASMDSLIIPFTAIGAMGIAKTAVNDAFGV